MEVGRTDGIRNVVIATPRGEWRDDRVEGEPREAAEFYAALLGWRILREDWMKVGASSTQFPHLAFGDGWSDGRTPRWRDPARPTQAHVDIAVADVPATVASAVAAGATVLEPAAGGDHIVIADPFGHPVCLRAGDPAPSLTGVVLDCAVGQADAMAAFYAGLLARTDDAALLDYQEVDGFVPTTWPDDDYPALLHLDLQFTDVERAMAVAEELGARRLPSPRPNGRIFADPAGHPFCICTLTGG